MILLLVAVLAQTQSPTLNSAVRARALLSDALAALGGLPAIESLAVTREYTGTRTDVGQNVREPKPGEGPQINGRPRSMRFRNYRTGDLVDITADTIPGGQPFSLRYVARGDSGFSFMYDAATLRRTPPPPPAVWRAFFQNEDVEGLLLSAWRQQGTARAIGPRTIVFTDPAQVATTIYFDSSTHLPLKSETLSDDAVRGDVVTETRYRDWRAANGLTLPYTIETRINGEPLQRLQLSAVRFGAVPDSLFRIPSDAVESSTPPAAPIALGSDVYVVPSRYQSAFVVFDDFVLVLEPGGSPGNARFTIASVKQVAPTKPIRYVVATHAHFDHLAGVREYIALGATFVTTPAAARVIQRASTAVHLMQPDSLSRHPRDPLIETMTEDVRVFRDATHEVRVYQLGPTTHVDAMLFAYVPATKTLFVADALDIPEPGHVRMGGEDTQRLADRIAALALDVERIVPVHGRMGTLADLDAALAKRARQVPVPDSTAIVNVSVIPMDGERVLEGYTVMVVGGVITTLGPTRRVTVPAGTHTIDGTGKYLVPGFADVHVHLANNPPNEQPDLLKLFLAEGVTTVLNLRGIPQILELRASVASGKILGPRLYTVGPFVNEPFVGTPAEVDSAVVAQKRAGYDFIKLHGNLSRESYLTLMRVAAREGIRVIGHAPRNLGLQIMFDQRQYALAHAEEFLYDTLNRSTDSSLPYVEARIPEYARSTARAGIWVMPNLTAFKMIGREVQDLNAVLARPEMRYLPRSTQQGWGPATNPYTNRTQPLRYQAMVTRYHLLEKLVRELRARGVRLLVGTDAMNPTVVPGFSTHDEMADLVTAGLTPYEALRAATANAAEFLGVASARGTIAAGQEADLVLLDANPLADIANTRHIAGVMLRGRWFSGSELAAMLEELGR